MGCESPNARRTRRDGWTLERQLAFLSALRRTRCVTAAAAAVGMTREGAYRLRRRPSAALFAAQWDAALAVRPAPASPPARERRKGHKGHSRGDALASFDALLRALHRRKSAEGHEIDEADRPPSGNFRWQTP